MGAIQIAGRDQRVFNYSLSAVICYFIWTGAGPQGIHRRIDSLTGLKQRRIVRIRDPFLFHSKRAPAIYRANLKADSDGHAYYINFSGGTYHLFSA